MVLKFTEDLEQLHGAHLKRRVECVWIHKHANTHRSENSNAQLGKMPRQALTVCRASTCISAPSVMSWAGRAQSSAVGRSRKLTPVSGVPVLGLPQVRQAIARRDSERGPGTIRQARLTAESESLKHKLDNTCFRLVNVCTLMSDLCTTVPYICVSFADVRALLDDFQQLVVLAPLMFAF